MPRRIDAGEVLAAVGGVLVLVALFLDWFEGFSGWEAFEALDLVIAVLALVAVLAAVASVAGWSSGPSARVLPWVGAALVAVIAVQLIEPPPVFAVGDPERETGAWLALTGAALVLLGGLLRAASISVTVSVGGRDVRRRVPAVDRRPEAAPEAGPEGSPLLRDDQATQPFSAVEDR
ncbi:MAG TPA: hypothetical protein VGW10_06410 [Solirubrobacteraceae bacterium]|nr:hypothetical protein [Solirubrobacteraceae bacterium]